MSKSQQQEKALHEWFVTHIEEDVYQALWGKFHQELNALTESMHKKIKAAAKKSAKNLAGQVFKAIEEARKQAK